MEMQAIPHEPVQLPLPLPLTRISECLYELPQSHRSDMRVPVRVFADDVLIQAIMRDQSLPQLINVATLPGIVGAALGMPDMHEGYGFPVGGVAATLLPDGVISPGGIGFDINCGVRLLSTPLRLEQLAPELGPLMHELSRSVPAGYGRPGKLALDDVELDHVLNGGCPYLIREHGLGFPEDLEHTESGGCLADADAAMVSARAKQRGRDQLGTLGGGNHFLELQVVEAVDDEAVAAAFGLSPGQITVLIHSGSRGLGHQVCTDYVRLMDAALGRHGIVLPDRQLACAPLSSREGQEYFAAMCGAANFGWCNRQALAHKVRQVFYHMLDCPMASLRLVYDVGHNNAKIERHGGHEVCVHRKGATRAFGPGSDELPPVYRGVGQPVLIPGSMGTASFVMVGTDASSALSLGSACHGAGRAMSRGAAKRETAGHIVRKELTDRGIVIKCPSNAELAEEAPLAYKDVDRVVDTIQRAGIARKVARLRPIGVLKG